MSLGLANAPIISFVKKAPVVEKDEPVVE